MTMDARKQRVLQAIVALYGLEGEPVGSSVLANYFDMAVSSATLRNEMAALTKLGLLEQPHTSAGRVPSAKGYRYYLDHLLTDDQPLDRVTRARVDAVFASLDHEPEKLAQGAAKALAAISGCTAAVSTPCAEDLCIAHYEVVQVGRSAAAVLAVTTAGYVRTRVARVRTGLSRENAAALAALLNRNLTFVAPVDLSPRLLAELCSQISPELVPVISAAAAILQDSVKPHVFLGGEQHLLDWPQLDGQSSRYCSPPRNTWGFTLSCKIAAAALTTGTSSGAIWLHSSLSIRVERSTGATKVRLRLSSAARAAAFSRESPVRTRATRVRT